MPYGNGRRPDNFGPMTGRKAGFCSGFSMPGYSNFKGSRFFGRGMGSGGGRGHRNLFYATGLPFWAREGYFHKTLTKEEQIAFLRDEAIAVKTQMDMINGKISELENIREE